MQTNKLRSILRSTAVSLFAVAATAAIAVSIPHSSYAGSPPKVGQPAPEFSGISSAGEKISLSNYRGRTVVLEWTNHQCPYVRKHYSSNNMQSLQKLATNGDVVWISIVSSGPGHEGYIESADANRLTKERGAVPSAVLLDPSGSIGRLYKARVTPHMFVIDGSGTVVYMGGIDDRPSARPSDIEGAANHVLAALDDIKAGRAVVTAVTRPYGCSVNTALRESSTSNRLVGLRRLAPAPTHKT